MNDSSFTADFTASPAGTPTLYRPSGRVSPLSLTVAALVLIPLGLLLGVVYSAAVVYLPFLKLRGLITFFAGVGLGAIAGQLCYRLKYRNRPLVLLTILGFTGIAYYTSWAVHPALVVGAGRLGDAFVPALINGFDPRVIATWMQGIFDNGIWGMGGGGALSGWATVLIWLVEAGLIFGMAVVTGMGAYGTRPFCEHCHRWNEETEDLAVLPVSTDDPAWTQIRNGNFQALKKLQIAENGGANYVELRLADCPSCDESDYLSAIGIALTTEDGVVKKNETDLFRHLSITRAQREEIVAFAGAMAAAVEEMKQADQEALAAAAEEDAEEDQDSFESTA
jgi:hypothetical protein